MGIICVSDFETQCSAGVGCNYEKGIPRVSRMLAIRPSAICGSLYCNGCLVVM